MPKGQPGMTRKHARPGGPHDATHGVPFLRPITMDRAIGAGGFPRPQRTAVQPRVRIIQKVSAIGTPLVPTPMGPPAINPNHGGDGPLVQPDVERQGPCRIHTTDFRLFFTHGRAAFRARQRRKPEPRFRRNRRAAFGAVPFPAPRVFESFGPRVGHRSGRFKGFPDFNGILLVSSWHEFSFCACPNLISWRFLSLGCIPPRSHTPGMLPLRASKSTRTQH